MKLVFFCLLGFLCTTELCADETPRPRGTVDDLYYAVLKNGVELGDKAETHRYVNLRAGAIKTEQGWSVVDFASSFFNPNAEEITVAMTMIGDVWRAWWAAGGGVGMAVWIPPMATHIQLGVDVALAMCWHMG